MCMCVCVCTPVSLSFSFPVCFSISFLSKEKRIEAGSHMDLQTKFNLRSIKRSHLLLQFIHSFIPLTCMYVCLLVCVFVCAFMYMLLSICLSSACVSISVHVSFYLFECVCVCLYTIAKAAFFMASVHSCVFWSAAEASAAAAIPTTLEGPTTVRSVHRLPPLSLGATDTTVAVMAPIVISISVDPGRSWSIRFDPRRLLLSAALNRLSREQWNAIQIRTLTGLLGIAMAIYV